MKVHYAERLLKSYAAAPAKIRKTFDKQIRFLLANLQHPSLHAKKYDEATNVWQARINKTGGSISLSRAIPLSHRGNEASSQMTQGFSDDRAPCQTEPLMLI